MLDRYGDLLLQQRQGEGLTLGIASQRLARSTGQDVIQQKIEAEHIRRVLTATATIDEAAAVLGIDPSTLYRKRKRYGL